MPPNLLEGARHVARVLQEAGFRTWIVGGAVRDLARGITPKDVDLVSAAPPEIVEELFPRTVPVGKAFGIMLVIHGETTMEVATFRGEGAYSDGRHPDQVSYGATLEEDAARRDFTCNAIYLDPISGELRDPSGGLHDLSSGRLRPVGDARARFSEDGLRILRLARFRANLNAQVDPSTLDGARKSRAALEGVSPERVLEELQRMLDGARALLALETLDSVGALSSVLSGATGAIADDHAGALRAIAALQDPPGVGPGLAVLLAGSGTGADLDIGSTLDRLDRLRPSRATRKEIEGILALQPHLRDLSDPRTSRSRRILALRDLPWAAAMDVWLARAHAWGSSGSEVLAIEQLRDWMHGIEPGELRPDPLLKPSHLDQLAVPRGPRWGELLALAERDQLDGRLQNPEQVEAWLRDQTSPDGGHQVGG